MCGPTLAHFQGPFGLERGQNGLQWAQKWAHSTCLCTPNGLGSILESHIFYPFLTDFWSQNSPFSRHVGILGGPKRATTSSKCAKNTCFGIPCGPGSFLKKVIFLHPVDLVGPFWHPPLWATSCSLPQRTGPRYGGLGVGWSNFEGWKPPKVGGCGWIRCTRNHVLSHVAQDMVWFWFGAVRDDHTKYEPETQKWRPGTGVASAGPPFQNLQFRARTSLFLPKTTLEPVENGQMKGNSGYSTHAVRLPRAEGPSRAL